MKIMILALGLVALTIAGCSASAALATPTSSPTATDSSRAVGINPPASQFQNATWTPPSVASTPSPNPQPSRDTQGAPAPTSSSLGVTKTYTNAKLQIALDYPSDWTVRETANGASFTSPQGAVIDLANANNPALRKFEPDLEFSTPQCRNITNVNKLPVQVCLHMLAFGSSANITLTLAGNQTRIVTLSTRADNVNPVLDAMIASIRLAP